MLVNLILILVVICLIYQLLSYLNNRETYYQIDIGNMDDLDTHVGFRDNGYMIQNITNQKYLTHTVNDKDTPLKFDMSIVKSMEVNNQNYDVAKFMFYKTSEDGKFLIKTSGPIDPRVGDTFISTTEPYGLRNSKPNIESKTKAESGGTGFNSVFEIENDEGNIYKINKERFIIKPYVPDVINKINEYNLQKSIERQRASQIKCAEEATRLVETTYNKTIDDCARDCDSYTRCSHFQYYYGKDTNNNQLGRCELFKKCDQEKSSTAIDSVIYKKSDKNAVDKAERDRLNRMLGIKNKNYGQVTSLIEQNTALANEIREMLINIKSENPQFASPESNSAAIHVNRHREIIDLIDDPSRLDNFRLKISQNIQDYQLCDLEREMADLEKLKADVKRINDETSFNKDIKGVKSFDNSQILNVYPGKKTNDNSKNHLIFGNGKCLAFNQYRDPKTNKDINQYDFIHCNVQHNQQQFNIRPIENLNDYNSTVKSGIDRLSTDTYVDMDFNVINPKGKEQECLTLNDSGLTVEPCTLESNQRFSTLDTITAC